MPTMNKTTNTIVELPNGWLNRHTGCHYDSAAQAHAAVLRADRKVKIGAITLINWLPLTVTGAAAIRAL